MKNKTATVITLLLAIFMIIYAGFQIWKFVYNPYDTEVASRLSVNDTIHVSGLAVRNEMIIEGSTGGSISYIYEDGSKVNKNRNIAYTHGSKDTILKMEKASNLEKKISQLEDASGNVSQLYGSYEYINTQIGKSVVAYAQNILSNDLSSFNDSKDELLLDINRKKSLTGEENNFAERIDELKIEYEKITSEIESDESEVVVSPKNGYFISNVDGFENVINRDNIFEMQVSDIENIINKDVVQEEEKIGKIADSYKWYYIFAVSKEKGEEIKDYNKVTVNFDGISKPYTLEIESIIEDDSSDNAIVVLLCKTFNSEVSSLRQVEADITFYTYSGLKISNESIRFDENQNPGVFILEKNEVKFRKIEIIYQTQNYSIVKEQAKKSKYLQRFDEVFVGGNDLYSGKIIE